MQWLEPSFLSSQSPSCPHAYLQPLHITRGSLFQLWSPPIIAGYYDIPPLPESQGQDYRTCIKEMFLWAFQNSQTHLSLSWESLNSETKSFLPSYISSCLLNISTWTFHWHRLQMSLTHELQILLNSFLISVNDTAVTHKASDIFYFSPPHLPPHNTQS